MPSKLDKYREWSWLCDKTGVSEDLRYLALKLQGNYGTDEPRWNLNPDYQRDHVWTERQKELFLGHYIEGGHMQPIYVQRYESEKFQELP